MHDVLGDGKIHAAIDLGTNSFHLLIARLQPDGRFDVVAKEKEMVRLGSGSGDMYELTAPAIDRGIAALRRFRQVADSFDADITAIATSALREASNRAHFLQRAMQEAGISVEVVSGAEEARLIHLGVLQALPVFNEQVLVVDIGGGSTEFLVGRGRDVRSAHSTNLGAIRLTDQFFPEGVVAKKSAKQCRTHVRSFLVPTIRRLREHRPFVAIGSSGTINTIARMVVAQRGGDPMAPTNGALFTREELGQVIEAVLDAPTADERTGLAGLDERRRDIIVAGAVLLEQILDGLAIDKMIVSEAALREGILLDLAVRSGEPSFHHLSDIRRQSVLHMAERYHEDLGHTQRATDMALELFDQTEDLHGLDIGARDLLEAAGLLHNVGSFISHAAHHKHSYYVIRQSDQLSGFTDAEIEMIAQVARYHRKSEPKATHADFQSLSDVDQGRVRTLAGLLRIGIALDRTRQGGVEELVVTADDRTVTVGVRTRDEIDFSFELYTANQRSSLLSTAIDRDVSVELVGLP